MGSHTGECRAAAQVWVCTFATKRYRASAAALLHSALRVGGADRVVVYDEDDVDEFMHVNAIDPGGRGYGWFAWKPWCIMRTITHHAVPGDVVVWCDAGMTFSGSLRPYVDALLAADSVDIIVFRLGEWHSKDHSIGSWTKPATLRAMGAQHRAAAPQVNAAIHMYKHGVAAAAFVGAWLDWCRRPDVICDPSSTCGSSKDSTCDSSKDSVNAAHRWDQSILSVLVLDPAHAPHIATCRDPTQYGVHDPLLAGDAAVGAATRQPLVDHHRQQLRLPKLAVITPTIGGRYLEACVASVQAQDVPNIVHWIVVDGRVHEDAVRATLEPFLNKHPIRVVVLPCNTGANGYNGHMCYGAAPWIVDQDADYVAFLDDDNLVDPEHYKWLLHGVTNAGVPWAHSLRRVIDREGRDVCADNCESLGGLCVTCHGRRLVDTSCYLLKKDLAIEFGSVWHARFRDPRGREPDRDLAEQLLLNDVPHVVVRRHSVQYRAGNTAASVDAGFFMHANALTGYDFAQFDDLYVFHFSPDATSRMLAQRRMTDRSYALDEWQMTLWKGLDGGGVCDSADRSATTMYNLLHGYACAGLAVPYIPPGAVVAVAMCQPDQVPWEFLRARTDLWRIGYTLESPNIRHCEQWDFDRLAACFDVVLTYWDELLRCPYVNTLYCPHNTHHLDLQSPLDLALLRDRPDRASNNKSACMVLERRELSGTYSVPKCSKTLTCLDPLRPALVRNLRDVTVYGQGWALEDGVRVGHTLHRSQDPQTSVDIMSRYTFALIVENCDAEGYVSEKLYDALMAGAIPLYYGNVSETTRHIPRDIYVDLKEVLKGVALEDMGSALQTYLDSLSDEDIGAMRRRVLDGRLDVLRAVDVRAFADSVRAAIRQRPV